MSDSVKWLYADRALALMTLSTATCVVYDHLTTLDDEIELVWKRPKWSVVQVLFLTNRYVGDGLQIFSEAYSEGYNRGNLINVLLGFLATILLGTMQGIMSYRVSSMYNHSRKIVILLVVAFVAEVSLVVIIQILTFRVNTPVPQPAPDVWLCAQNSFPSWFYTVWIPIIMFELLILLLSTFLAVRYYQALKIMKANNAELPDSLPYILLRDSITFPFICLTICIINLIAWTHFPYLVTQFTFALAAFAPIILGSRLILNLRETYYQPFIEELNTTKIRPETPLQLHDRITRLSSITQATSRV